MSTPTATPPIESAVALFDVTEAQIAETREKYAALDASTPAGYEEVRQAVGFVRDTRVAVEKRRVALKAGLLARGREIDSQAKRLTALIESIEEPLVAKKQAIDDEKARIKAEAEAAKLKELQDRLAAERAVEEARLKSERDAEDARLKAERERLDAERATFEEEKRKADAVAAEQRAAEETRQREQREKEQAEQKAEAERLRVEREAIEAEKAALAKEKEEADRVEFERQAKAKAEKDAADKIEADRLAKAEREAAIQALLPDAKKLDAFAAALRAVPVPTVKAKAARAALSTALAGIDAIAGAITSIDKQVA